MSPSFLEAAALAALAERLQRTTRPETWRRETARAVTQVRPEVLILSSEAAGLRAAWAMAQVSRTAPMAALCWDDGGRHLARPQDMPASFAFEVRELTAGMRGGLPDVLHKSLSAPITSPGLIVFVSSGWGAQALLQAQADKSLRARAAQWRRCYLLADDTCLPLHPDTRLPTYAGCCGIRASSFSLARA